VILVPKREFTSFDVAAVVRELKETVLGSRVSNVYQLDAKTLLLKLHKPEALGFRLVLGAGKRLHLTAYAVEKPSTPPAFCMALRKYLRNGWLTDVEQYEFERVVILSFKAKTGELQLVLELFGEGNVVLVGDKGKILQALTYKRMRDRNVLRGETFAFAPPSGKNPVKVSREEIAAALKGSGDVEVVRAVARVLSIGGFYAEEVLLGAAVDKTEPCSALSDSQVNALFDALEALLSRVVCGRLEPCVVLDEAGGLVDVVPFMLRRYEGFENQRYQSFNEALDEFYVRLVAVEKATAGVEVEELKREAERLKRIVETQEETLVEAEAKVQGDKLVGDTIYAHGRELQVLLDKMLTDKKGGKPWGQVVSEVLAAKSSGLELGKFFESLDAKSLMINVSVDGLQFNLNLRESLFENAGGYYERSKRAKQKLAGAEAALEETRAKLVKVEAKIRETESLERVKPAEALEELAKRKIKHKEWFEKFRWFVSSDGFLVVAGKDAVSNEVLIKKHTEDDDVVFHADVAGAPFVVVKTEGKKPGEQCLREAAEFAAAFSRGWREGFGSVDVYWVRPSQLSKGGPSGEYVPHGAFVVRGQRNWLRSVPLRIAIGVAANEEEGRARIGGGPFDAVKANTKAYIVLVPGDLSGKELFQRVLRSLAAKVSKEVREAILNLPVEEIRVFIPYGKGTILQN
jgi:predicted ribosome quality control (RQC) complex YloA/Tae2 family protein